MCQFRAYVGIIFFGRSMSHSFFVTVSRADHRATQGAGDGAGQPGNLTIIPAPLVAALPEPDYPSLQEESSHLLHGLQCTHSVWFKEEISGIVAMITMPVRHS